MKLKFIDFSSEPNGKFNRITDFVANLGTKYANLILACCF